MSASASPPDAGDVLKTYAVDEKSLYVVGCFDDGVTVYTQQVRAINLAWALVETGALAPNEDGEKKRIAVLGGGFAGLTLAAALIKKGVDAEIALFERFDALLPLQQGCDSRWLHPRIYDWPSEGSEAGVASLPVLNWNAGRASDVVVQVLKEWDAILAPDAELPPPQLETYFNTKHLRIEQRKDARPFSLEWIGELRIPEKHGAAVHAAGVSRDFDFVVLALGFGLEAQDVTSYWRNESLGQPDLGGWRRVYIVSGQGDGAVIDLCRLRIANFRQDRILDELFGGRQKLLKCLEEINAALSGKTKGKWFEAFAALETTCPEEFEGARDELATRLRRDTDVILHMRAASLLELFNKSGTRLSFQNRLLLYLLYKTGAFVPSSEEIEVLAARHGVSAKAIVRRHGPQSNEPMKSSLPKALYDLLERVPKDARKKSGGKKDQPRQLARAYWPGGYFGEPIARPDFPRTDEQRGYWRREYLPGPTSLLATSLCGAVAGNLLARAPDQKRLRVTLHRSVMIGAEEVLQQCCDYCGKVDRPSRTRAGRTFPRELATIGVAYGSRRIVRSRRGVTAEALKAVTEGTLRLDASQAMNDAVNFVLAIPILEPDDAFTEPSPVSGVLYIDSIADAFWIDDEELARVTAMVSLTLASLTPQPRLDRIRNTRLTKTGVDLPHPRPLPANVEGALELVAAVEPPRAAQAFQFNFDYVDFLPVQL